MSAIVGVFNLDGRPVSRVAMAEAMDSIKHYGGDGSGVWIDREVALGHHMRHITPESRNETLPLRHGDLVISFDGRLDNRGELFDALAVRHPERVGMPDSQLILAAYQRWLAECPNHLIGEFAFSIWDASRRRMFCAGDHIGCRPLYYFHNHRTFGFATDVRALWRLPDAPKGLDELQVALYLHRYGPISNHATLYQGVSKLALGHQLEATQEGLNKRRYWDPFDRPAIRFRADADYQHQLRDLIREAVACRLRTDFPVATHLSGGLDSSTITAVAVRGLRERGKQLAKAYSYSPPPAPASKLFDERHKIRIVSESLDVPVEFVSRESNKWHDRFDRFPIMGEVENYSQERAVTTHAASLKVRTLLTGLGGDQGITLRRSGFYPELLRSGHWLRLCREWRALRSDARSHIWGTFLAFMPRRMYSSLYPHQPVETFVSPDLASRYRQELGAEERWRQQPGVHQQQRWRLEYGDLPVCVAEWTIWGAGNGIKHTYPLLDRRVLEFAYRIPGWLFVKDSVGAHLFRVAAQDVLPSEVLWDSSKFDEAHYGENERLRGEIWRGLADEANRGDWDDLHNPFVDIKRLRKRIVNVPGAFRLSAHGRQLASICQAVDISRLSAGLSGQV